MVLGRVKNFIAFVLYLINVELSYTWRLWIFLAFEMLKASSVFYLAKFIDSINVIELKMDYIVRVIIVYGYVQIYRLMILVLI